MLWVSRIIAGLTFVTLAASTGWAVVPHGGPPAAEQVALHRPDFSASGVDPMPVGTAKQVVRMKRARSMPKA